MYNELPGNINKIKDFKSFTNKAKEYYKDSVIAWALTL